MNVRNFAWLMLLLCLSFGACKNDDAVDPTTNPVEYQIPVKEVLASMSGTVFNESGNPIEEATVELGNTRRITDENGAFYFQNIEMNEYGTLLKVSKPGYFNASQMIEPRAGKRSNTRVMLLAKTIVGSVMADAGGTLTANGDSKITLPANGIINDSGDAYTGEVRVAAKWINPTDNELGAMMPGDLRAINEAQELVQLATFGMLAVELEGTSGEALNIAEGSKANLEFPVPAELRGGAPNTIPLWYFNEETGFWEEEGEATFDGEKYVGDVSHFSYWNCDAPFPLVEIEGTIVDLGGNPIPDVYVGINISNSAYTRSALTDADGAFGGKIPKDEVLTLTVFVHGQCDGDIYSETIGPFSSDVVLPAIEIDLSNVNFIVQLNLNGQMENCNSETITNGYIKITYNGGKSILFPDDAGVVSGSIFFCPNVTSVNLEGYDQDALKKSDVTSFSITPGMDLNFGTLSVCEDLVESLTYTIDGDDFFIFDPSVSVDAGNLHIAGFGPDSSNVNINMLATAPGTYTPENAYFSGMTATTFPNAYCQGAIPGCADFDVVLTHFAAVGEYMQGTFSGTMDGSGPGGISTVSGAFKVLRE